MFRKTWKHFCYLLEYIGMLIVYAVIWPLPFKWASAVGGKVARLIGPLLPVSNNARRNLKRTFPEITSAESEKIIAGMWENIGRTIAEYAHLRGIDLWAENSHVEIVNPHIIDQLRDDGKPAILFLGHIANWEYATMSALQRGLKIAQLYRVLNNPYIARFISWVHGHIAQELVTKGAQGAKQILSVLKRGDHVSMLIDQKLNEGIAVPFLGRDAMTAPALAKLALKFRCPVVPVRVERLEGIHCRVTYYPPLPLPTEGNPAEQVYQIMLAVNDTLSGWIQERPQDWMWVHNRWPQE